MTAAPVDSDWLPQLSDGELGGRDPLEINLRVAAGVPALAGLDIPAYRRRADAWVAGFCRHEPRFEAEFHRCPADWNHDLALFRLGQLYQFLDQGLGIRYKEDQRDATRVLYTDPSDLFVNGVMDTRRGTCGNMAVLYLGLAWRLGWPVTLATAGSHLLARYDDGRVRHNVEVTALGCGGFSSPPDRFYCEKYGVPEEAVRAGWELRSLRPREALGVFYWLRARHFQDTRQAAEASRDSRVARELFP
jgi:hypothetical protein